tara:strand:+ start:1004 stop:1906 length:903 start_codon:yes stop_codon:yes gene_type:complete
MDVPVVVIGNITIGGTGKTPLVIWLVEKLIKIGMKPGLICSGYNSNAKSPQEVLIDSRVSNVGDEALMTKLRFKNINIDLPIFVGKRKAHVGMALINSYPDINILISDDGLQHNELNGDFEIVVVDADRVFGNGYLIPAGPLRENISRIKEVDALVLNGHTKTKKKWFYEKYNIDFYTKYVGYHHMECYGNLLVNCHNRNRVYDPDKLKKEIVAITGIGNPERFFEQLSSSGLKFKKVIFNDHHLFTEIDFKDYDDMDIIMTEKDSVKCKSFAKENFWYLPMHANVDKKLFQELIKKLRI